MILVFSCVLSSVSFTRYTTFKASQENDYRLEMWNKNIYLFIVLRLRADIAKNLKQLRWLSRIRENLGKLTGNTLAI